MLSKKKEGNTNKDNDYEWAFKNHRNMICAT
jgi:hypothetical protein